MPRININEKDRTSPGTPGGYSNNTVLIAGFSAYTDEEIKANAAAIQADDNGIFEFESVGDFETTIGLVAPVVHVTEDKDLVTGLPTHYGNQMAYELLKMGYPVIYINLGAPYKTKGADGKALSAASLMEKLADDATWEIFKDKASYDFRFVSHGLLTSAGGAESEDLTKLRGLAEKMRSFLPVFDEATHITDKTDAEGNVIKDVDGNPVKETVLEAKERMFQEAITAETAYIASTKKADIAAREAIGYTDSFIKNSANYAAVNANIEEMEKLIQAADMAKENSFTVAEFNKANAAIAKLAHYKAVTASDGTEDEMDVTSGRGDCIALIEVDEAQYITNDGTRPEARIIKAVKDLADINADNGKYCACTVPSVVYNMAADERFGGNKKFPGAFHYLACFDNSLGLGFAEWYAAAGYTRGVSSYTIDHTTVKLGEIAVQALEPRNIKNQDTQPKFAVNVIANFRGNYYLWGNRTCHPLGDAAGGNDLVASHFLNIRQLCTTIKKQLYVSCRRFTFDPNSDVLWINFKNSITPMLDRMKADQGVRDYKIEKVYTDKKATLKARIRIVPIEAVEDFLLEVSLEDSLGETAVTIAE